MWKAIVIMGCVCIVACALNLVFFLFLTHRTISAVSAVALGLAGPFDIGMGLYARPPR